ncbi:hypothetical protein GALL_521440 [mine drainage metagenome]|uniref:Uncharacterized protein n=1 Tax=mine drainage metagenome TaxID=410659 RepID=A0A1J5PLV7_9ZZZZ
MRSEGESILNSAEAAVLLDLIESLQRDDPKKRTHILVWSGVSGDDLDRLERIFGGGLVEGGSDDLRGQGGSDQGVVIWRSYAKM